MEFRESLSLRLLFIKCLQLKGINTPKQHILEWQVLKSFNSKGMQNSAHRRSNPQAAGGVML